MGCSSSMRSHTALIAITIGIPRSKPQIPHSQPQTSRATNTVTALSRPTRCVNYGTSSSPITPIIATMLPITRATGCRLSNCAYATKPTRKTNAVGPA